ncbi:unnamed protein product [Aphis gossypii]|uniref:MD-2-related lipid-recognition domain-containing protein n=1 Tax=Aphis gossypii TaxID=80765 RepID=A0A9P0NFN4_APHGO|nr:unnamed protein product [Aphis gossypii]
MKHYIYFMFIQLIFKINSDFVESANVNILSTSPIGPFKMVFKRIYSCNPTKNNKIQHNFYLSHRDNTTFVLGNTTSDIPLDDTLSLEIKLANKDSFGNWNENAFMHKSPNACSALKKLYGIAWNKIILSLGFKTTNCPILPGFYLSPGLDTSVLKDTNLPKAFLYGTYKSYIYYTRQNEIFGCVAIVLELKRP